MSKVATFTDHQFPSLKDNFNLHGTFVIPTKESPEKIVVVIGSATGTKRGFYLPFAEYLASNGIPSFIFDYRGIGDSRPKSLVGFKANLSDWMSKDLPAALEVMGCKYPDHTLVLVAHSVAGHALAMATMKENDPYRRVARVFAMGSQNAHWNFAPSPRKYGHLFYWYVMFPVLATVVGYLPAKKLGLMEDLPKGVAMQWAYFGRHKRYVVDAKGKDMGEGRQSFDRPILATCTKDDEIASARQIRSFHDQFVKAPTRYAFPDTRALGIKKHVGHMGMFRKFSKDALWGPLLEFIRTGNCEQFPGLVPSINQPQARL